MNTDKKYSVLMSVYKKDRPDYLISAIESMLKQTIPPEQYVIVVDGPISEELQKVVERYRENEGLFTVLELEENGGLANALNHGLEVCRNELVARMDADDISLPERCERELEYFDANPELVICGCNIDEFYGSPDNVKTSRVVPSTYEEIKKFMRRRQAFNHPTVMYKKSKVLGCGGYSKLRRKEDFDLFSRMVNLGCYTRNLNESLYLYRVNIDNYKRRKSWTNFRNAIQVYMLHLKRKGCSVKDFIIISLSEFAFFIAPLGVVKWMSDTFLRKQKMKYPV